MSKKKHVYSFGAGKAEGAADMKDLLGGKGANLAEMTNLGIPVPAGFTITTEVCNYFQKNKGKYPLGLKSDVEKALKKVEKIMGRQVRRPQKPLADFRALRRPGFHARHDGHGAEHRPQRHHHPGAHRQDQKRAISPTTPTAAS